MRARVRRTAACGPHGTTRPHDLPIGAGNTGTRAWSPPPRRSTPAARRTPRCEDPPEMQWSACKTSRPWQPLHRQTTGAGLDDLPGPARSPRKHPDAAGGAPSSTESPDVASHGLPTPGAGRPTPTNPVTAPTLRGPPTHSNGRTGDGAPSSRRPHAPSTLAPSRLAGTIVCPIAVTSTTPFPIVLLCSRLSIMDICHVPGARCQVPGARTGK